MFKIPDLTKIEINYILENANFTKNEETLFNLRNMEYTIEMCAEEMNVSVSTVKRLNKKMLSKIIRIF